MVFGVSFKSVLLYGVHACRPFMWLAMILMMIFESLFVQVLYKFVNVHCIKPLACVHLSPLWNNVTFCVP